MDCRWAVVLYAGQILPHLCNCARGLRPIFDNMYHVYMCSCGVECDMGCMVIKFSCSEDLLFSLTADRFVITFATIRSWIEVHFTCAAP